MKLENSYALIIGISNYQSIRKLPYTDDAKDIATLLSDPEICGYSNVESLSESEATSEAIIKALDSLATRPVNSTVMIYFSGHGASLRGSDLAGEYLLPYETVYPSDSDLNRTAISGAKFTEKLNAIGARASHLTVMLDCCHAGGIGETKELGAEVEPGLGDEAIVSLGMGHGRAIFAAALAKNPAWVKIGAKHGNFTQCLINGLRGGAKGFGGVIRVGDLINFIEGEMTKADPPQQPYFKFEGTNYPIANHLGGKTGSGEVIRNGLQALIRLAKVPELRSVIVDIRDRLQKACKRIGCVVGLKKLHDGLHDIQIYHYVQIKMQQPRLPQPDAAKQVVMMAKQIGLSIGSLREAAAKGYPTDAQLGWIDDFDRAARAIAVGAKEGISEQVDDGIWCLNEILGKIPSEVNTDLLGQIRAMSLRELFRALMKVQDAMATLDLPADDAREFAAGGLDLGRLDRDINDLMEQHDGWQEIDNLLRRIENNRRGNPRELNSAWPQLSKLLDALVDRVPVSRTHTDLSSAITEFAASLEKTAAPGAKEDAFDMLLYVVRLWFHDLDRMLLDRCGELSLIDAALRPLLAVVMEPEQ